MVALVASPRVAETAMQLEAKVMMGTLAAFVVAREVEVVAAEVEKDMDAMVAQVVGSAEEEKGGTWRNCDMHIGCNVLFCTVANTNQSRKTERKLV